jgi:uncharacterized phage protein gp47/JayE
MALSPYIDETGVHVPEYQEILDDLKARWREIFGQDLYLEADSQEGEMLQIFALACSDAYQFAVAAYQSFSPQTAQGAGLSRMVKINGIRRRPAARSQADVRVVGVAGTVILGGIVEDVAGRKWNLPASVTIPYEGEITVAAVAQELGAVRAQPGEIRKIATPTRGWQSVENPGPATPGAQVESDAELRQRQTYSVALPSSSVFEGILGAVASLSGVARLRGYENDTDQPDANGVPGHCVALVVEGGDPQEIATTIHRKKTPGTGTYGALNASVADKYGIVSDIRFFRPAIVPVAVDLEIRAYPGYSAEITDRIKDNLAAYVNGLGIGSPVLLSRLYTPLTRADQAGEAGAARFEVLQLQLAREGTPWGGAGKNVPVAFNELAALDPEDISISIDI